jgi:hypothetical protein
MHIGLGVGTLSVLAVVFTISAYRSHQHLGKSTSLYITYWESFTTEYSFSAKCTILTVLWHFLVYNYTYTVKNLLTVINPSFLIMDLSLTPHWFKNYKVFLQYVILYNTVLDKLRHKLYLDGLLHGFRYKQTGFT